MNPIMVLPGRKDALQSLLLELGFDNQDTMEYLVTLPEFMDQIADNLKPIGRIIFLRAIPVAFSPSKSVSNSVCGG
jgi:hypothetical protein